MARKGEKVITATDFETRLSRLEAAINSILSFLVFNNTTGEIKNFMIQHDRQQILGAGTAVTFFKPFKAGTVPTVVGTSELYNCYFALSNTSPTNTGFNARSRLHDGTANTSVCGGFAIGERG